MSLNPVTSVCRSCRYYTPEGRRGGNCQQLGVPVRGGWRSCSLAIAAFTPAKEALEEILTWEKELLMLRETLPLEACRLDASEPTSAPLPTTSTARSLSV